MARYNLPQKRSSTWSQSESSVGPRIFRPFENQISPQERAKILQEFTIRLGLLSIIVQQHNHHYPSIQNSPLKRCFDHFFSHYRHILKDEARIILNFVQNEPDFLNTFFVSASTILKAKGYPRLDRVEFDLIFSMRRSMSSKASNMPSQQESPVNLVIRERAKHDKRQVAELSDQPIAQHAQTSYSNQIRDIQANNASSYLSQLSRNVSHVIKPSEMRRLPAPPENFQNRMQTGWAQNQHMRREVPPQASQLANHLISQNPIRHTNQVNNQYQPQANQRSSQHFIQNESQQATQYTNQPQFIQYDALKPVHILQRPNTGQSVDQKVVHIPPPPPVYQQTSQHGLQYPHLVMAQGNQFLAVNSDQLVFTPNSAILPSKSSPTLSSTNATNIIPNQPSAAQLLAFVNVPMPSTPSTSGQPLPPPTDGNAGVIVAVNQDSNSTLKSLLQQSKNVQTIHHKICDLPKVESTPTSIPMEPSTKLFKMSKVFAHKYLQSVDNVKNNISPEFENVIQSQPKQPPSEVQLNIVMSSPCTISSMELVHVGEINSRESHAASISHRQGTPTVHPTAPIEPLLEDPACEPPSPECENTHEIPTPQTFSLVPSVPRAATEAAEPQEQESPTLELPSLPSLDSNEEEIGDTGEPSTPTVTVEMVSDIPRSSPSPATTPIPPSPPSSLLPPTPDNTPEQSDAMDEPQNDEEYRLEEENLNQDSDENLSIKKEKNKEEADLSSTQQFLASTADACEFEETGNYYWFPSPSLTRASSRSSSLDLETGDSGEFEENENPSQLDDTWQSQLDSDSNSVIFVSETTDCETPKTTFSFAMQFRELKDGSDGDCKKSVQRKFMCVTCRKNAVFLCKSCGMYSYCSEDCILKNLQAHGKDCGSPEIQPIE